MRGAGGAPECRGQLLRQSPHLQGSVMPGLTTEKSVLFDSVYKKIPGLTTGMKCFTQFCIFNTPGLTTDEIVLFDSVSKKILYIKGMKCFK